MCRRMDLVSIFLFYFYNLGVINANIKHVMSLTSYIPFLLSDIRIELNGLSAFNDI